MSKILVTGGAGYTGSVLVNKLLLRGYKVKVIDLLIYGSFLAPHPNLEIVKKDIRSKDIINDLADVETVFHLAGVSNDPGYGMNPIVGDEINYNAVQQLLEFSKASGVRKFVYPSSCSVYGESVEHEVHEESPINIINNYSRCKVLSEEIILKSSSKDFCCTILRPATVCGVSPRQRFDLLINGFVNYSYFNKEILLSGSQRIRPSVHIDDLTNLYEMLIKIPDKQINGQIFNVAFENRTVYQTAKLVSEIVGGVKIIDDTGHSDKRSYYVNSQKIQSILNFTPQYQVSDAIQSLYAALREQRFTNTLTDSIFYGKLRQPMFLKSLSGN